MMLKPLIDVGMLLTSYSYYKSQHQVTERREPCNIPTKCDPDRFARRAEPRCWQLYPLLYSRTSIELFVPLASASSVYGLRLTSEHIELPRRESSAEQRPRELRSFFSAIFPQAFHDTELLLGGEIKCFSVVWCVREENVTVNGDNDGNDAVEDEHPSPSWSLAGLLNQAMEILTKPQGHFVHPYWQSWRFADCSC